MSERRDRIRVHIAGKEYYVVGGEFQGMLAAVKQITGRRFVGELKVWQLPGTAEEIQHQLSIGGYELEGGASIDETTPIQASPATAGGDRIRIQIGPHQLAVVGGSFQEMLQAVKNLPGRRFDSNTKMWEIPSEVGVVKGMIEVAGFQLEGAENIPVENVPGMEPVPYTAAAKPPAYETPDFFDETEAPPYEPPDWWDDEDMPPPMEPPGWDDRFREQSYPGEPTLFDDEPGPVTSRPSQAAPAGRAGGDRIRIRLGEVTVAVTGGSFQAMLAVIKNIPGRRFNSQDKVWEIPEDVTLDSVDQTIQEAGFTIVPE